MVFLLLLLHLASGQFPDLCDYDGYCIEANIDETDPANDGPDVRGADIDVLSSTESSLQHAGQFRLQDSSNPSLVNKSTLVYVSSATWPNAPWEDDTTKVWSHALTSETVQASLSQEIPFLGNTTFLEVLTTLRAGCNLYLFGGIVRDALTGIQGNDVDISFTCTATELYALAQNAGYNPSISGPYVRIPQKPATASPSAYIEGFGVETSLYADMVNRDFACNTLWYDFTNDVIIDRSGIGVQDALVPRLSLPVVWTERTSWAAWDFKPGSKLFRFFKFRARKYEADPELISFVQTLLTQFFQDVPDAADNFEDYFRKMIMSKVDYQKRLDVYEKAVITDFGSSKWYDENIAAIANFVGFENQFRLDISNGSTPVAAPTLILTGGGTGAGKSSIRNSYSQLLPANAISLDSDDLLLHYPPFQSISSTSMCGTALYGRTVAKMTSNLLGEFIKGKYNLIFDGTMAKRSSAINIINNATKYGYVINMIGATKDVIAAAEGALIRAQNTSRWVPLGVIVDTHVGYSTNFLEYTELVNSSYLFETSVSPPRAIYAQSGGSTQMDNSSFDDFLAKKQTTVEGVQNGLQDTTREAYKNFEIVCLTQAETNDGAILQLSSVIFYLVLFLLRKCV